MSNTQESWTENQMKFINFLARGKTDKDGNEFTEGQFAKIIGVDQATLWRWKHLDGFGEALLEATRKELQPHLPKLSKAILAKAAGNSKFKNIDIPAANLVIKLMGVAERTESKLEARVDANVTLTGKTDEALEAIIQGMQVA